MLKQVIIIYNITFNKTLFFSNKKLKLTKDTAIKIINILYKDKI